MVIQLEIAPSNYDLDIHVLYIFKDGYLKNNSVSGPSYNMNIDRFPMEYEPQIS